MPCNSILFTFKSVRFKINLIKFNFKASQLISPQIQFQITSWSVQFNSISISFCYKFKPLQFHSVPFKTISNQFNAFQFNSIQSQINFISNQYSSIQFKTINSMSTHLKPNQFKFNSIQFR